MVLILTLFFAFSGPHDRCDGQIYKYKDEHGNWCFTDTPFDGTDDMEVVKQTQDKASPRSDLERQLLDRFHPRSGIEKASIGTVTIQSDIGSGSGFFITKNGYLLTNRHVIRGDKKLIEKANEYIEHTDAELQRAQRAIAVEEARLEKAKRTLQRYKESLDARKDSLKKRRDEAMYKKEFEMYQARKEDFEACKERYEAYQKSHSSSKLNYYQKTSLAGISRTFKIILKDDTELTVYLVSISEQYDLALLKLDGYKTPSVVPVSLGNVVQGQQVYAIGSPINLRDTVSAGVVSGFEKGYIKTDAKIYPGNSGGPLITKKGSVIGINTLKKITRKFEGLGFAIPVGVALEEFSDTLGKSVKLSNE